jgi:hypothetical protein
MYCVCKERMASQIPVNNNFCTVMLHKCRACYIEGAKLEIAAKDLVIL